MPGDTPGLLHICYVPMPAPGEPQPRPLQRYECECGQLWTFTRGGYWMMNHPYITSITHKENQ